MKTKFMEHYSLNEREFSALWRDAIIVFDTNILLNLYRYSATTRNEFIKKIKKFKDRVWIPYHVGSEFHKDRIIVINQQIKAYSDIIKKISEVDRELSNQSRNPFLSSQLYNRLNSVFKDSNTELKEKELEYSERLVTDNLNDKIAELFKGKIGDKYTDEKEAQIFLQGAERYVKKIPPGFGDIKKPENEKYGDLIIWNQIIDKAILNKKPIIFVTDDEKEDWWHIVSGKTIGPNPDLLKEFHTKTKNRIYLYGSFRFLEFSNKFLKEKSTQKVINEVKNLPPLIIPNDDIQIEMRVSIKKDEKQFFQYIQFIMELGYEVRYEKNEDNTFTLYIPIPNIPDLGRRFLVKSNPVLESYDITLIDYKVNNGHSVN